MSVNWWLEHDRRSNYWCGDFGLPSRPRSLCLRSKNYLQNSLGSVFPQRQQRGSSANPPWNRRVPCVDIYSFAPKGVTSLARKIYVRITSNRKAKINHEGHRPLSANCSGIKPLRSQRRLRKLTMKVTKEHTNALGFTHGESFFLLLIALLRKPPPCDKVAGCAAGEHKLSEPTVEGDC